MSVLREIDAVKLRVVNVRKSSVSGRTICGPQRVLVDVEYRNGNRGTVELTLANARELEEMLKRVN